DVPRRRPGRRRGPLPPRHRPAPRRPLVRPPRRAVPPGRAGTGRRSGRDLRRRAGARPRLSGPAGPHRGRLRARSLEPAAGSPSLPHRRSGAPPERRRLGISGPPRPAAQAAGYRIEPGEVEAALLQHPGVQAAAVGVVEGNGSPETRALTAWIVPAEGSVAPGLREHLRGKLPAWMVPSAFVEIPALPLTAGGKIDRGRLTRNAARSVVP